MHRQLKLGEAANERKGQRGELMAVIGGQLIHGIEGNKEDMGRS